MYLTPKMSPTLKRFPGSRFLEGSGVTTSLRIGDYSCQVFDYCIKAYSATIETFIFVCNCIQFKRLKNVQL